MATVTDTWHISRGTPCAEHGRPASSAHGKGKRWQVRYRDLNGRQRKESYAKKALADARKTEVENDLRRGTYVDPGDLKTTFRVYAEQWRKAQPHRPGTAVSVEVTLRKHAYPTFGARRLGSIKPSEVQGWVTGLVTVQGLAPGTARLAFAKLRAVFRSAVLDGLLPRNPCAGVKVPLPPRKTVVPLTVAQVRALADEVPEPLRALIITGAGTGLRAGELLGLRTSDVNFLKRTVRVEQQVQRVAGKGLTVCPPKTASSHRTVPLPRVVADALALHLSRFPAGPDDFVFGPLAPRAVQKVVGQAVAAAGLPAGTGLHALRHAYASMLIHAGESVKVVSERLGHTNAAMTLGVYAHLFPQTEDRTRRAVDDAFSAPDVPGSASSSG